ncbi:MAG TPA: efflux RND transporter periplasmic adaptor subunit, partial [Rhodospirillales bacterium]|nr:efflux RND transporter periplasmic adaptor subunit [Rhodospirillales bacterium]
DVAQARLDLARRDLRNATLAAPFGGSIAARMVDPFVQVQAGQELFRMDAAGGRQASIGVPETAIGQVVVGMPATVALPQLGEPVRARVSEIGSAASAGNAFPVKLALIDPPAAIRPGMTAEVTLLLSQDAAKANYFIPISAITAGVRANEGFVFVYDPASSTVRRTLVQASGSLTSDRVAVTGLAIGDIVATAGVNFLRDGQRVTLMAPPVQAVGR